MIYTLENLSMQPLEFVLQEPFFDFSLFMVLLRSYFSFKRPKIVLEHVFQQLLNFLIYVKILKSNLFDI